MYEQGKGIQARYLEYIKKFTNTKTGIYTRRGLITFKKAALFDYQVNIIMPETFDITAVRQVKHPFAFDPPLRVEVCNHDNSIHFALNLIDNTREGWSAEEVIREFRLISERLNPTGIYLGSGSGTGEQLPYAWIDFIKQVDNRQLYHMLIAAPVREQLLLVLFVCPDGEQTEWKECLGEIREGITL